MELRRKWHKSRDVERRSLRSLSFQSNSIQQAGTEHCGEFNAIGKRLTDRRILRRILKGQSRHIENFKTNIKPGGA